MPWSPANTAASTEFTVTTTELNQETEYFHEEKLAAEIIHYCPSGHFEDVRESDWFHGDVDFVVESGWMNGMTETEFGSKLPMTRAQFVTVLYRMEGEPDVTNTGVFKDIKAGEYYADAVYWAYANGITDGTTETTFDPEGKLTRSHLVTFMYRYGKHKGYDVSDKADISGFRDAKQIKDYALEPWRWSVAYGIVNGTTDDTLSPEDLTDRSQAAAIIHRFARNYL